MFKKVGKDLLKAFNTGVSYFMPVVVIGGIFLALSLATGQASDSGMVVTNPFMQNMNLIGSAGMAMMIPVLSAYIAYSLAGKPGLAPGFVAGYIANNPAGVNNVSTGFLGAMLMGVFVGYVVRWMKKWKVNDTIRTIMPILIIPIVATFICCTAYLYILVGPLGWLMNGLTSLLKNMEGGSSIVLGIVIGLMTAADMGGPINKTASAFTLALMAEGIYGPNGAFRVCCAIPPLGLALATFIAKKKFDSAEKQLGISAFFMGLIGITEGAIPFAVKSMKTVLPAILLGCAVGGGLAAAQGVECFVPHGGFIVALATNNPLLYSLDIVIGSIVTCVVMVILTPSLEVQKAKADAAKAASKAKKAAANDEEVKVAKA